MQNNDNIEREQTTTQEVERGEAQRAERETERGEEREAGHEAEEKAAQDKPTDKSPKKSARPRRGTTKRDIISRVKSLYAILFLVGIAIVARLIWIIAISPSVRHNAEVMEEGIFRMREIDAHRGTILSRDGEPLAISSLRYSIFLDFGSQGMAEVDSMLYIAYADSLSRLLASHFNEEDARRHGYRHITAAQYRHTLLDERTKEGKKMRHYKILPRQITEDEWSMMSKTFPILNGNMGYVVDEKKEDERLYPSGDLARQFIGHYDTLIIRGERHFGAGIEGQFNRWLAGTDGLSCEQRIAHGFWARVNDSDNRPVEDGCNIITTIDAGLQRMAHERLDSMLRRTEASFGVAMVMEVKTGNILAMVNLGSGVERGTTYSERVNNHALKTKMNPGSTMKLATTMALVEIGGYDLDTKVNTEHSRPRHGVKVGNATIEDSHDVAGEDSDGNVTLRDAFAHSSNVYFAKAVYERFKDNPAEYTDFLARLRFNDYIGLQAYDEHRGVLPMANTPEWSHRGSTSTRLPRLAYGYELELPPIHMLTFYNGVANEGRMVAPRFVDRIERDGEVVERMPVVTLMERMCSQRTLAILDTCLAAASERSGRYFRDLPIPFGCKTGTAQVWTNFVSRSRVDSIHMANGLNGKEDNYYYGSMICTMPQENPKYTIMVAICKQSTPDNSLYFGIDLAGPVAADMLEYIYANDHSLHAPIETPTQRYSPVSIKAGQTGYVKRVSNILGEQTTDNSDGSKWSSTTIDGDGNVAINGITIADGTVPNVVGMGLTDALYLLECSGLRVTHSGTGRVRTQSIPAGRTIRSDNPTIHLTLER